jgi:hypothetical protein
MPKDLIYLKIKVDEKIPFTEKTLHQSGGRGSIEFKNLLDTNTGEIRLGTIAEVNMLNHEIMHYVYELYVEAAKIGNAKAKEAIRNIKEIAPKGKEEGVSEYLAENFEKYLAKGKSPNIGTKEFF